MAQIILGVTGSVAAIRTPVLAGALRAAGNAVRVVATEPSLHFFSAAELDSPPPGEKTVYRDADEWPATPYRRDDPVLHIDFRNWADLLIVAPLDANTLAKFACGLADNFLTCLLRAWDFRKPLILAPAMNTLMWESPMTVRHFGLLLDAFGDGQPRADWSLDAIDQVFARHAPGIVVIPPMSKRLACGDIGTGAMAEVWTIAEVVRRVGAGA